ncbi:MAG: class I SAM-dependent methyltransferase [Peptococcaceae bacterium]|jgi:demethylmenaquinone methyltransferase/2-methoxy-6-polyprenyl-1,4-benzoquinol methylase|nr:class I SAM-dependent methyltransferase [Peptococcaceae bacterium]MDH7524388.1 class I SAM-dependent methyltransferase [Peptococcaceae bacterium]
MVSKKGVQFAEKEQYVKGVFAAIAPVYDRMNVIMTFGLIKGWRRFVLDMCRLKPGGVVLDVGTGTGEMAFQVLQKVGPAGKVIGVDISEEMLSIARKKLRALYSRNGVSPPVFFKAGDALALPFPDGMFDCVVTAFTLRNVSSILLAVGEMARVCQKGGRVVCLEISEPVNPLLRTGFRLYFNRFIPLLGRLAGRGQRILGKSPAYTWLSQSLRDFPQGEEMAGIFSDAGLSNSRFHPLSGGMVTVYVGEKA